MSTREPLVSTGTIVAAVTALLALLVSFGLDIDDDQQAAILAVTAVVVPLVTALGARGKVTPVADPRDNTGALLERRTAPGIGEL